MIATVTLNPSLDRHVAVENLVLDDTNRWVSMTYEPGGKGINVSRAICQMGGETKAYGLVGGDDGEVLKRLLKGNDIPCDFTSIHNDIRSNFIITDLKTHRQTRISAPGPQVAPGELKKLVDRISSIRPRPSHMVFAGSVPPGVPDDIYFELIIRMKSLDIITVLDSADRWLKEGFKARPDIIKPNVREAQGLMEVELKEEEDIIYAAKTIVSSGIKIACISRGREGMIIADKKEVLKVIPPDVEVLSTVGAGDSTVAALILKLSQGGTLEEAARLAIAAGTATTLTAGTELCHKIDVDSILPQVSVERLLF
ncbi:MAG: 1-phosphofructokinase [Dehalococcoidia bacterium]|nr:1-phosphofructokinase [Dehalococcoidia bacterium]